MRTSLVGLVSLAGVILFAVHHFDINFDKGRCSAGKRYRHIVVEFGNLVSGQVQECLVFLRNPDVLDVCGVLLQHSNQPEAHCFADFVGCPHMIECLSVISSSSF